MLHRLREIRCDVMYGSLRGNLDSSNPFLHTAIQTDAAISLSSHSGMYAGVERSSEGRNLRAIA
jgi:hypothetical protein